MTDEIKPTDDDVRDALKLLRALTGGEPYAPHVYPTAREIARIAAERRAGPFNASELALLKLGLRNLRDHWPDFDGTKDAAVGDLLTRLGT